MEKYLNLEGLEYLCQKMKTDLTRKQDQLTGQPGQVVGFDAAGSAIPQNLYTPEDAVTVPGGGAIEIDGSLGEGPYTFEYEEDGEGSAVQADQVSYDSGGSGLEAATVQGALDALSAVKADVSRVSNPNLLDNWYFADPVNQRGQAEYGRGYTIDRWFFGCDSEESKVMVGAGGIGLRSAENSGYNNLEQRIPKSRFLSGVYTLSFLVSNPGETKQVYIFGVDTVWDPQGALCSITAYVDCNALPDIVTIGLQKSISATPLTVIAAKLELGSQQTLAHRDASGNWVLNDPPPNKALELAKCQRYQVVFCNQSLGLGYLSEINASDDMRVVRIPVQLPVPLRNSPTITTSKNSGSIVYRESGRYIDASSFQFAVDIRTPNETVQLIQMRADATQIISQVGSVGDLYVGGDAQLILDANL